MDKEKSYILSDILHTADAHVIPIYNIIFDGASTNTSSGRRTGSRRHGLITVMRSTATMTSTETINS